MASQNVNPRLDAGYLVKITAIASKRRMVQSFSSEA